MMNKKDLETIKKENTIIILKEIFKLLKNK